MIRAIPKSTTILRVLLMRVLQICCGVYALACMGCAAWQRHLIYFPPKFDTATADRIGREALLDRWTNAAGQAIGWKRLSPVQPAQGRVLMLHGNAGAALYAYHYADSIQQTAPYDVYLAEYPGYADMPGSPTET